MEKNALASDAARAPELVAPAWFPPAQPIVAAAVPAAPTWSPVAENAAATATAAPVAAPLPNPVAAPEAAPAEESNEDEDLATLREATPKTPVAPKQPRDASKAPAPVTGNCAASNWRIVGAQVQDAEDSTVRGVITDCPSTPYREVTTTSGAVVLRKNAEIIQTTLTDAEVARCVRPTSMKDYVQARVDGAIETRCGGRDYKNRYTATDGTERRQLEVTTTEVRCNICWDAPTWSLDAPECVRLLKEHCGTIKHARCLEASLGKAPASRPSPFKKLSPLASSGASPPPQPAWFPPPQPIVAAAVPPAEDLAAADAPPLVRAPIPVAEAPAPAESDDAAEEEAAPSIITAADATNEAAAPETAVGQRVGRARTKPQRLTDSIDGGKSYAPAPPSAGARRWHFCRRLPPKRARGPPRDPEPVEQWHTTGSDLLGVQLSRTVNDGGAACKAVVVSWLSASESDFVDTDGRPAALYKIRYLDGELAGDHEDLEAHEVEESIGECSAAASWQQGVRALSLAVGALREKTPQIIFKDLHDTLESHGFSFGFGCDSAKPPDHFPNCRDLLGKDYSYSHSIRSVPQLTLYLERALGLCDDRPAAEAAEDAMAAEDAIDDEPAASRVEEWILQALYKHGGEDWEAIVRDPAYDALRRGRTAQQLEAKVMSARGPLPRAEPASPPPQPAWFPPPQPIVPAAEAIGRAAASAGDPFQLSGFPFRGAGDAEEAPSTAIEPVNVTLSGQAPIQATEAPAPEERTSAAEAAATAAPEEHTDIKLDGEIKRLGTFATAGAAVTYDSAREEVPVNSPLPGQAPVPAAEAPAPAEDEEAAPPSAVVGVAAAPPRQLAATGSRFVVGTHLEDANDSTVRGVVTDCVGGGVREMTTTTGAVVMLRPSQIARATLTDEEAALCVRPVSRKDYVQARIDGAIRFSHGGREFKNCYTCADGTDTERRQFVVTATHVRCALCGDTHSWPLEKDCTVLVGDVKQHCGQTTNGCSLAQRQHLDRLVQSAGAPPPTAAASTTPAPAPAVSPSPAPAPCAPAPDEPIQIGMVVEAPPNVWGPGFVARYGPNARYRGTVLARDSGEKLPIGCPTPMPGERIWLVRYDDDWEEWATPERFLRIVAPVDGQRAGRERTKPQFLSGCVDAGRAYVPAQDEVDAPGAPVLQRFAVDDLVQADFLARGTYYDGVVLAVRRDDEKGLLYRIKYDDDDEEEEGVPADRIRVKRAEDRHWVTGVGWKPGPAPPENASRAARMAVAPRRQTKAVRGPPEPWEGLMSTTPAPKPSVPRERKPAPSPNDWVAVGSHVQHSDGLRGVVTNLGYKGQTEVTTKTGYAVKVYRTDLTKILLTAEEAAHCDRSRLTPNDWMQTQLDGAVCAVYEGREFGNCFATKDGRTQRMFSVESSGDVRCALCDWTAPERASKLLQNDLSAWGRWFNSIKQHSGQFASTLTSKPTRQHVERVLALAAEPSTQRDEASPSPTATNDSEVVLRDEGATPEWWPTPEAPQAEVVPKYTPLDHEQSHDGAPRRSDRTAPRADTVEKASVHEQVAAKVSAAAARPEPSPRPADERAERDKAAEEGALQPRRRSTPAKKRDAPTGPATWLSTEGADAVRSWRSTLAPDAWDALAAADGLTLNNVPARGWHRELKGAGAPLPPAPTPHVASTTSAWVAVCTDLLELAGKEKGGLAALRGELESRGFRCSEPRWEGKKEFDVSMPQEFPCYYDIVGKDYTVAYRQDFMSSKSGLVTYLEGCIALAQTGRTYRTTADREADGDEAARRAGKRATKAQICFHHPGQFKASDALRSRSAVERYLAADATPLFESPPLDAFSFENDVAGDFPSPPPGYYSRLSAKVVEQLRPAAPALTAAPTKTPATKKSQRWNESEYRGVRGTAPKDAAAVWKADICVHGTRVRIDHATEREAAISYDAVRVWYRGESRINFPERWPGDGSSNYAGVSRNAEAVTTHASWHAHHDGRDLGSFDDEKVAARVYDFARHCQGQPVVNFDGSGDNGETFCAYCEDWEYRAVAERDGASILRKYGHRFFEDPDHPEDVYYVVPTGVQWTETGMPTVKADAVGPTDMDPGQVAEGGNITYLLNDELRRMIAATPQGLMIVSNEGAAPEPQPSLAVLKEDDDDDDDDEKEEENSHEEDDPEAENRHWVTGVGWKPGPAPPKGASRAERMASSQPRQAMQASAAPRARKARPPPPKAPAAAPAETPSRKRPRPDDRDDSDSTEVARLRQELDSLRAATQALEQDLRASEAQSERCGRQRDEARGEADRLRGDVKRLRRERDEARGTAASSERALEALRQKLDRDTAAAAQRDDSTPARPAKRGRHSPADEPVGEHAEAPADEARDATPARQHSGDVSTTSDDGARLQALIDADDSINVPLAGHRGTVSNCYVAADGSERRQFVVSARGDVVTCTLCSAEEFPNRSYKCRWTVTSETRASYGAVMRKALVQHSGCRPAVCKATRHKDLLRSAMGLAAASDGEESDDEPPATTDAREPVPQASTEVAPEADTRDPVPQAATEVAPEAGAVPYPVDALVEARWRGGTKYYPAIVLAVGDNGRTVDIEYCDDSDEEYDYPVEMLRPASRRLFQRYSELTGKSPPAHVLLAQRPAPPPTSTDDKEGTLTCRRGCGRDFSHPPARAAHEKSCRGKLDSSRPPPPPRKPRKKKDSVEPSEKDAPPPLPTEPCAICMSTISEDACVLACGHAFHAACLGEMADVVRVSAPTRRSLGVTCPLCRKVTRAGVGAAEEA
jgi:hypothetical protein